MLAGFQHARALGFRNQHLDFFFRHRATGVGASAASSQNTALVEMSRSHTAGAATRDKLVINGATAHAMVSACRSARFLGTSSPMIEREVRDRGKHDDVGQPVGDPIRHAPIDEDLRQFARSGWRRSRRPAASPRP